MIVFKGLDLNLSTIVMISIQYKVVLGKNPIKYIFFQTVI
jgi:hypothetical protein